MADRPTGIDPRGPRFAASITAALLLVALYLALVGVSTARGSFIAATSSRAGGFDVTVWGVRSADLGTRALDPGFLLLLVIAALFLWSVAWPSTAPWGVLYRRVLRPRLGRPAELEDPRPPRFAQGVGLVVVGIGLVLHLAGVPWALPIAAAAAFVAAFLNAAFGLCLGCLLYLALQRAGLIGRPRAA